MELARRRRKQFSVDVSAYSTTPPFPPLPTSRETSGEQ
jgi:hypothetical protein